MEGPPPLVYRIDNEFTRLLTAGKINDAIPYITTESVHQISLANYAEDLKAPDVPEFVEKLFAHGYMYDIPTHFDYFMYWFYETKKLKSAQKLLECVPHRFDYDLFRYMCDSNCMEGMIRLIDMGIQLDWVETDCIPEMALTFHFARNRARKRAMILLWVPARAAGGDRGAKRDIFRIIARVIWSLRRFN